MREWRVRRVLQPHPDGQRHCDRTYSGSWPGDRKQVRPPRPRSVPSLPRRRLAMRVALYARVSTHRQAQADGIAQQLDRLRARALAQGWTVSDERTSSAMTASAAPA